LGVGGRPPLELPPLAPRSGGALIGTGGVEAAALLSGEEGRLTEGSVLRRLTFRLRFFNIVA
jgi:hypothetical protein